MNPAYKKIYTCTPVAFHANDGFHIRDTGLIASTLRSMGVESRCIMPLPYYEDDQREYLIRTEYSNLESADWWRSLGIDALVLYSWGAPRYTAIARAVHHAGILLLVHLDMTANLHGVRNGTFYGFIKDIAVNILRCRHLAYADYISASSPLIASLQNSIFYGRKIARKARAFPTPVAKHFRYTSTTKQYRVVCVGRWSDSPEDAVKRPEFCIRTALELVKLDSEVVVEIHGRIGASVLAIYDAAETGKERVQLKGTTANHELPSVYQKAMVSYCSSLSEGTHIASAEALCCGCSVAVPPRATLSTVQWYTTKQSGAVAEQDTPESLAKAIKAELCAWKRGERDAVQIANAWQNVFHADKALTRIFN